MTAGDLDMPTADPGWPRQTVILGANGQLGRALRAAFPDAVALDRAALDLTDADAVGGYPWGGVGAILNAAAYTAVDAAETPEGRRDAWAANVTAVARLADIARQHRITLVHVSSDYVFEGTRTEHPEGEPPSPLGVYGATKAAGDALVSIVPQHYLIRTSWVVGEGRNFVATMADLARRDVRPAVVDDQIGRLTFTDDLAAGVAHLLATDAPFGTYNLTNSGPPRSWCDLARRVFELVGGDPAAVTPTSTQAWAAGKTVAPRPTNSALDLTKITGVGYSPPDADSRLVRYLNAG